MMKFSPSQARKAHRQLVGLAVLFLTVSAVTGLLWAYAPYLYWDNNYKQTRKPSANPPDLSEARITPAELLNLIKQHFGEETTPRKWTLTTKAGWLIYQVRVSSPSPPSSRDGILDAITGDWLSPLDQNRAVHLAEQYIQGDHPVEKAELLSEWVSRKQSSPRPAWLVRFSDPGKTEIFLDPDTGEILEDQDRTRRFHFLIMDLHQLNFFGFHKTLTLLPGAILMAMVITGFYLRYSPGKAKARRKTLPQKTRRDETALH